MLEIIDDELESKAIWCRKKGVELEGVPYFYKAVWDKYHFELLAKLRKAKFNLDDISYFLKRKFAPIDLYGGVFPHVSNEEYKYVSKIKDLVKDTPVSLIDNILGDVRLPNRNREFVRILIFENVPVPIDVDYCKKYDDAKPTVDMFHKIIQRYEKGESIKQLADAFKRTEKSVLKIVNAGKALSDNDLKNFFFNL